MGLHEVCDNKYHHFDRNFELEMIYNPERKDYMLIGVCRECQKLRIVYESQLKEPEVLKYKLNR